MSSYKVEETHLFLVINVSTPHSLPMTKLTKLDLVRLAGDGSNWVSYRDHLTIMLKMKRWQEHLTEDAVTQAYNDCGIINGITPEMRWEDDDQAVKHVIMNSVLDEVFNRIKGGASAKAWWDSLKTICEGRSRSLLIDSSAKINISYSILFHLTTSYSSYFGGKKGISRNKTSFFLLM